MRPEDEYKLRPYKESSYDNYTSTSKSSTPYAQRERHGCLTIWLYLYVILAVISICILLPNLERMTRVAPLLVLVLLISIVTEGVSAFFVLQWKRWAVNALTASIILSFALEVLIGAAQLKDIIQLIVALGILAIFVQPHLDDYE